MKRVLYICVFVVAILAIVVFWTWSTRGVELSTFSRQIIGVLQAKDVSVVGMEFEAAEDTPLPLSVKWNPLFWQSQAESSKTGLGTGARGEVYTLKHGAAIMECRVRRDSEIVEYLEIRSQPKDAVEANEIRNALAAAFPGLVVGVRAR